MNSFFFNTPNRDVINSANTGFMFETRAVSTN